MKLTNQQKRIIEIFSAPDTTWAKNRYKEDYDLHDFKNLIVYDKDSKEPEIAVHVWLDRLGKLDERLSAKFDYEVDRDVSTYKPDEAEIAFDDSTANYVHNLNTDISFCKPGSSMNKLFTTKYIRNYENSGATIFPVSVSLDYIGGGRMTNCMMFKLHSYKWNYWSCGVSIGLREVRYLDDMRKDLEFDTNRLVYKNTRTPVSLEAVRPKSEANNA